ncbi:Sugar transport protein 4 [Acorus calamus]|uniref:Sugar transport protein 4 n=1 Tax=Acorus calamus TaxID=4465 RepID=A0AAV9DV30_ACOCL|nr:Sugar transport protein 4 [Acorus calamus]
MGSNLFSHNLVALIIGSVLLGINHGFISHFMSLYIYEMTPENHRDMLNMIFTQMSTIGIFTTNTINYFTSKNKSDDGWRISLGLAAVPTLIIWRREYRSTTTNLFSHNPVTLIIGCVLLGINHGFINHFMPFYISEMTPENHRDMLNMIFTQMSIIGIFTTSTINYFTSKNKSDDGWRISLGLAAVPSLIITIGSLFLFDTPTLLLTTNAMSKPGMCSIASTTP